MITLHILTSDEYKQLENVSFLSEAPVETLQKSLKKVGTKANLNSLMGELKNNGYNSKTNKK